MLQIDKRKESGGWEKGEMEERTLFLREEARRGKEVRRKGGKGGGVR